MSTITDEDVEDFIAHYGVKGMRWGVRNERKAARAKNRQLNRESRAKDNAKYRSDIDRARSRVSSGKTKAAYQKSLDKYKQNKKDLGSREAKKILRKDRAKYYAEIEQSRQVRDGKELTKVMLISVGGALAVGTVQTLLNP